MSDLILYTSADARTRLDLRVEDATVWLSQLEIAELFQTTKQNVSLHAKNIVEDGELVENSVVKEPLTTRNLALTPGKAPACASRMLSWPKTTSATTKSIPSTASSPSSSSKPSSAPNNARTSPRLLAAKCRPHAGVQRASRSRRPRIDQ